MANDHPFQSLFETLGRLPTAHAEPVNRQAYELLYDILTVPVEKPGRCILLRAPRAGHGKTHLLARIQHHLGSSHEFIPLHAAFGCQIDAGTVIDDALRRLLRPLPASGGLCVLDLVARRLFASALQPLVASGEVPCQDREGALTALRTRPIETFDFHHPNAVTAHWARENFEVLGQRLSMELAQRCNLPIREVAFWVDALFRFAATPVEDPARLKSLADTIHGGPAIDGVLMERLEALLGMLTQLMRVVLVADDLEGFSSDETAALRLAAFLGALRQSVERIDVILSLNQDIWQSAFVPRLSGGLADRLSEVVVELNPLTENEMIALLESRVPGLGSRVLAKVDRDAAGTHARGLIRAAGVAWLRASAMDAQPAAAAAIASVPPPPPVFAMPPGLPTSSPFAPAQTPVLEAQVVPSPAPPPVSPTIANEPTQVVPPPAAQPEPPPTPQTSPPSAPPVFQAPAEPPAVQPEPAAASSPAPEPATLTVDTTVPAAAPTPFERAPDPTLAIAFLAASQASGQPAPQETWPEPVFTPAPPEPTPEAPPTVPTADAAEPVPTAAPVGTTFESSLTEETALAEPPIPESPPTPAPAVVPEPAMITPPTAPESPAPPTVPVFEPAPASAPAPPAFEPVPAAPPVAPFQAVPEAPAEATGIPAVPDQPAAGEIAPPEVPSPPATTPGTPVPDTDRVDDLLRQFRERYGRGSL